MEKPLEQHLIGKTLLQHNTEVYLYVYVIEKIKINLVTKKSDLKF